MLIFSNKGKIDPRSITTFGVSVKTSSSAIGYFGTGLKYAIAVILREGGEITIQSGPDKYEFVMEPGEIRGSQFNFITMVINGDQRQMLGFTTELGKNWSKWQAFRELYCNCTDESGTPRLASGCVMDASEMTGDNTHVLVKGFDDIWDERNKIFLYSEPVFKNEEVEIHPGRSMHLYYKGVRVHDLSQYSEYTYNMVGSGVDLTEDRTLKYPDHDGIKRVMRALVTMDNENILRDVLLAQGLESKINYVDTNRVPSATFRKVVMGYVNTKEKGLNLTAYRLLLKDRPKSEIYQQYNLDEFDNIRLDKAIKFCQSMGIDVTQYPISIHETLDDNNEVMGEADMDNKKILLSKLAFNMGTKQVVSTLIEEYVHLKHGYFDCSRNMQSFLFDNWISMAERHYRNPL